MPFNSSLPRSSAATPRCRASRSEVFETVGDRQPSVEIDVYQGESDDVRQNHLVGKFKIEGLAPVPAGNQIVVQLDLDLNGMLRVSAREKATGLLKQITIENALRTIRRNRGRNRVKRLDELLGLPGEAPDLDDDAMSDDEFLGEAMDELTNENRDARTGPAARRPARNGASAGAAGKGRTHPRKSVGRRTRRNWTG